jgi:hypothetical protein
MVNLKTVACAALATVLLVLDVSSAQAPMSASEIVVVDETAVGKPFPHFSENMFGSGHAELRRMNTTAPPEVVALREGRLTVTVPAQGLAVIAVR